MTKSTLQQYEELKAKHPDALLLFRCGDFYECYKGDAEKAALTLGITLRKDGQGVGEAAFPHHRLDTYLPKLIRAGYRVAICDQLEEPKKKGWRKWPQEKPTQRGEYLVRGVGGLNNKMHYWVCLWVAHPNILSGLYYNGNVFNQVPSGEFEFIKCDEL